MSKRASFLLVDCGQMDLRGRGRSSPDSRPSLGLLYCAGHLAENGVPHRLVTAASMEAVFPFKRGMVEDFVADAARKVPDFLGFSTTSDTLPVALFLAEEITRRQGRSRSRVVLGGIGAASCPELILAHYPFVDIAACGEGEETLLELAAAGPDRARWAGIRGIAYRDEDGRVRRNPDRLRLDLAAVPVRHSLMSYRVPDSTLRECAYTMVTSRGCTGHCLFCSHSVMWKRCVTAHSPEKVVEAVTALGRAKPGMRVAFQDDDFLFSVTRVERLARGLGGLKNIAGWEIFGRLDRITPALARTLARGGCRSVTFGLDAVTEQGRAALGKPVGFRLAFERLHLTKKHIGQVYVNFIYGWAGETMKMFHALLERAYALRLEGFSIKIAPLAVYYGTPLHRLYTRKWKLTPNRELYQPLLGPAYRYLEGREELYPHLCSNRFDPRCREKKRLLEPLAEAFMVYDEL